MPKAEKYGVNQLEPAHEGKLGEIDSSYNIFWAKIKLNTRVLHSRDFLKVAAFSISTKTLAVAVGSALHGVGTGTANVSVNFSASMHCSPTAVLTAPQ